MRLSLSVFKLLIIDSICSFRFESLTTVVSNFLEHIVLVVGGPWWRYAEEFSKLLFFNEGTHIRNLQIGIDNALPRYSVERSCSCVVFWLCIDGGKPSAQ